MNNLLLNTDIQDFINENLNADINQLLLKGISFKYIETKEVIQQIEAKKRSEKKLPTWFNTKNIYFPNKINIEQTSSEITAKYKSSLLSGHSIIDVTGGFGIDCFYFSKVFKTVIHCEINTELSNLVNHNYKQLYAKNIITLNVDGIKYLESSKEAFDWIYIDPSRRHVNKGKVFFLNDCLPNIPEHFDMLFKHSKNIMIKTSPLLDLSIGINDLKYVKTIHIIAVNNEVKELLWILEKGFNDAVRVETINIKKETNECFQFLIKNEKNSESIYKKPLAFLYEPNSAVLKAGAFHSIGNQLNIFKLHQHSHLYTSTNLIDFPGRTFNIDTITPYNTKEFKKLGIHKANLTTRNFPETVNQLRKKLSITDGGDIYLFFTTDCENTKIIIIASKLL